MKVSRGLTALTIAMGVAMVSAGCTTSTSTPKSGEATSTPTPAPTVSLDPSATSARKAPGTIDGVSGDGFVLLEVLDADELGGLTPQLVIGGGESGGGIGGALGDTGDDEGTSYLIVDSYGRPVHYSLDGYEQDAEDIKLTPAGLFITTVETDTPDNPIKLTVLDPATGKRRWGLGGLLTDGGQYSYQESGPGLVVLRGHFHDDSSKLEFYSAKNGKDLFTLPTDDPNDEKSSKVTSVLSYEPFVTAVGKADRSKFSSITLRDPKTGKAKKKLDLGRFSSLTGYSTGKYMISATTKGGSTTVTAWDAEAKKAWSTKVTAGKVVGADGTHVLVLPDDNTNEALTVLDSATGRVREVFAPFDPLSDIDMGTELPQLVDESSIALPAMVENESSDFYLSDYIVLSQLH